MRNSNYCLKQVSKRERYFFLLFLFFSFSALTAQNIKVSGVVSDKQGLTLPGVNVVLKGTQKGVITDFLELWMNIKFTDIEKVKVFLKTPSGLSLSLPLPKNCLKSLQFEKMDTCVINNLNRGKEAGLFRQEIDVDFIGRIYYASAMSTMDIELFPENMFTRKELDEKLLEYHVRGIATPKGLETLEKLLINQ